MYLYGKNQCSRTLPVCFESQRLPCTRGTSQLHWFHQASHLLLSNSHAGFYFWLLELVLCRLVALDLLQITKCPRKCSIYRRVQGGSVLQQPHSCGDPAWSLCSPRHTGTCSSSATSTPMPWQSLLKTFYYCSVDILTIWDHLLLELAKTILALRWPFSKNGLGSL